MEHKYRAYVEVNLDALGSNVIALRKLIGNKVKIMAVVKADAYGHGFLEVAQTLIDNGVEALAVALVDEAMQLRVHGVKIPLLILGYTAKEHVASLVEYDITPTVFDLDVAKEISRQALQSGKVMKIHLKIDTGMTRIGLPYRDAKLEAKDTLNKILEISALPNIKIEGLFTHFAKADDDIVYTELQYRRFVDLVSRLEQLGISVALKHVCNSTAIINFPKMHLNMVRPGLLLYGLYPNESYETKIALTPIMQFKAHITNFQRVKANTSISYGGEYITKRASAIATVPIGYADGYSRSLSGKARMIAANKYCKIVGKICMDQCMIDVTNVDKIGVGSEVIIFGESADKKIKVEELSQFAGTINYETVCIIGKRVPRIYTKNGKIIKVLNHLLI